MKALLFGGSFNPPHLGHIALAREALRRFGYDKALLIPAWKPPHKDLSDDPGPEARLELLRAACAPCSDLEVEPCEIERRGISYSIDTVRYLVGSGRIEARPGFLLGDDLAAGFGSWKEADALSRESRLILMRREGEAHRAFAWPHDEFMNPTMAVSSSAVRALLRSGGDWRPLVPDAVASIIERNGYYGYRG